MRDLFYLNGFLYSCSLLKHIKLARLAIVGVSLLNQINDTDWQRKVLPTTKAKPIKGQLLLLYRPLYSLR